MKTKEFIYSVEHNLKGLEYVSTGPCPGCHECGLDEKKCPKCRGHGYDDDGKDCKRCNGEGTVEIDKDEDKELIELAGEPHFSWHECDCCGSRLGGDRHPAHGWIKRDGHPDTLLHLDICADCVMYLANGELPQETEEA